VWLTDVKQELGDRLQINWRFFPLEQVNAPDETFKLWEKPADYKSRGRPAFQAASAARQQGPEAFERFHLALLKQRHEAGNDIRKPATLEAAATEAELDLDQFRQDASNTAAWDQMRVDFEHGKNEYGVFGTPTIMFENGQGAYLKLNPKRLPNDPIEFFNDFVDTVRDRPSVIEIKRPSKAS
jgi:predicted DsbA family dithiol-disulfide isomerase